MSNTAINSLIRLVVTTLLRGSIYKLLRPLGKTSAIVLLIIAAFAYVMVRS